MSENQIKNGRSAYKLSIITGDFNRKMRASIALAEKLEKTLLRIKAIKRV